MEGEFVRWNRKPILLMFQKVKCYAFDEVEFLADIFPIFENAAQKLPDCIWSTYRWSLRMWQCQQSKTA